jgi:signal transduction histidine kinase
LENMLRRLAGIGGSCDIQSVPGQGTQVTFTVPLNIFKA